MLLTRYDNGFNSILDQFFGSAFASDNVSQMKTDVVENDNEYKLDIELAGFSKDDIKIELSDGYLTISANKTENTEKSEGDKYIRRERSVKSLKRSFLVEDLVDEDKISAKMQDGILHLTLPKKEPQIPEKKTVLIDW